ncbi:MAG: ABC transporter ATP-binding protein [Bacteroidetes bacterium]|nr:ABC transporter ATP-binding protein [Bacteroidota bacterium]
MAKAIQVEGLSKIFEITHENKERYQTLRDSISSRLRDISKGKKSKKESVEQFWALKDISFEINQGDRVGVIGRNGAGKSTLLKVISRITEPTKGRVKILGRVASLLEVGTGFHPELTGRENIFLNGAILGMNRSEIRKKFDEIVSFAEVEKFLDTPVKRYSSGMYVRLAFSVAAHLEPEILIVDEVLAVGDAQFQKKCLGKMEDVSKNLGRTVLFVSHNMGVISQLCNKGILLNAGTVEFQGRVDEIVERYISGNSSSPDSSYIAIEQIRRNKKNYFDKVEMLNSKGELTTDFAFNENVFLSFSFYLNDAVPNIQIGIGIQNKYQSRVATVAKDAVYFSKADGNLYSGKLSLPSGLFAPGAYSFILVLWVRDVEVYDSVDSILHFKIHDSGTEMSVFEGYDYGNVIVNPVWSNA